MRYALALDLHDDVQLIEEYERFHRAVWPEVIVHLRQHGVLGMEIYRLGTRLFMVLDTDDARDTTPTGSPPPASTHHGFGNGRS